MVVTKEYFYLLTFEILCKTKNITFPNHTNLKYTDMYI